MNTNTTPAVLGALESRFELAAAPPLSARIEPTPWGIKLGIASYSLASSTAPKAIAMNKDWKRPGSASRTFISPRQHSRTARRVARRVPGRRPAHHERAAISHRQG